MLSPLFDAFVEASPVSVMMRELMEHIFNPDSAPRTVTIGYFRFNSLQTTQDRISYQEWRLTSKNSISRTGLIRIEFY